ncbi:hypothetical protein VTL71DRAFT_14930 [Oculimacula yallundae]|uniref:Uncharacterized protein n=1 Tax=Oculimacula yallundae TaxID=86028 RepID=A0ABR4CF95_9HELO
MRITSSFTSSTGRSVQPYLLLMSSPLLRSDRLSPVSLLSYKCDAAVFRSCCPITPQIQIKSLMKQPSADIPLRHAFQPLSSQLKPSRKPNSSSKASEKQMLHLIVEETRLKSTYFV